MNDNLKYLIQLKEEIESAKLQQAQLKGKEEGIRERLQNDFNCKTMAQGKRKLEQLKKKISIMKDKLQEGLEGLEEKYESINY